MTDAELYEAYVGGETFSALGRRLGLSYQAVRQRILRHVREHGLEDPRQAHPRWSSRHELADPDRPRRSYELRLQGLGWRQVAELVGHRHAESARYSARSHALAEGLPWPMDVPPARPAP